SALHLGGRFYYVRPAGFTLSDYVAARTAGGLPIAGSRRLAAGSVLVVDARRGYGSRAVAALASSLAARGMRAVPLAELLASAASTLPPGSPRRRRPPLAGDERRERDRDERRQREHDRRHVSDGTTLERRHLGERAQPRGGAHHRRPGEEPEPYASRVVVRRELRCQAVERVRDPRAHRDEQARAARG